MNLADCLKLIHKGTQPEFHLPAEVIDRIDRDQEIAANKLIKSGVAAAAARKQGAQAVVQKYLDTTRKDLAEVQKAAAPDGGEIPSPAETPAVPLTKWEKKVRRAEKWFSENPTGRYPLSGDHAIELVSKERYAITKRIFDESIYTTNKLGGKTKTGAFRKEIVSKHKSFEDAANEAVRAGVATDDLLAAQSTSKPSQPSEQSGLGAGVATEGAGSVYKGRFQDKDVWFVQESEKRGFGDSIHDSEAAALKSADLTLRQRASRAESLAKVEAQNKTDTEAKSAREDLDEFDADMTPMQRGRVVKQLTTELSYRGRPMSRRDIIRQMVGEGRTVETEDGVRRLINSKGEFLGEKVLTKAGLDYAEHLIRNSRAQTKSAPETAPVKILSERANRMTVEDREPVLVAAVEKYGIDLPAGYVREGDRYVFKSSPEPSSQASLPENLRSSPEVEAILSGAATDPEGKGMSRKDFSKGGAIFGAGGGKAITRPAGTTPKGSANFIRVESAPKRLFKGLFTEGSADVLAKSKNPIGKVLSQSIKRHVDLEQEINGQLVSELDRATKGFTKQGVKKAITELEPYLAAKENKRTLPVLSKEARSLLTDWENIAEKTGLMAEAHNVQVFDASTGKYRPMHRMGRAYVPRVFRPEVQRVLSDPRTNSKLFNDLVDSLATHRGITLDEAATELRGVAGRFQSSDFLGNLEMARTGQLPEIFYDYNLGNIAARFIPSFSERMAQIISYGQRLGPRDAPLRENLWDVAIKEAEDSYTQQWLRAAEDQSANLKTAGGAQKAAQQAQTLASGLLLSSPTTSVIRNTLSGLTSTGELLGVRRSLSTVIQAATNAQTKLDAREIGAVRENLGDFLHVDQLGQTKLDDLIRGITNTTLKYSLYNGSEGFVRTHAAATASQFAKDGIAAIRKDPKSRAAKEALALFKRSNADAAKIFAENADWKTGPETRKFVRGVIRESQGGYRFDQVPLWANSAVGRFFYQFGRWGTQRARNIWKNGIKPLVGEDVEWNGKTMTHRNPVPLLKMAIGAALLGEAYALVASMIFDRDRKDASLDEIRQAFSEDQKKAVALAAERLINDVIMSGMMGIWGQPVDFVKSLKDQSRFKNPAEPPGLGSTKALGTFLQSALDQQGEVTTKDVLALAGGITPGAKQLSDLARNVLDEPLYEAENDVRTLRAAASRWAADSKMDVPKRAASQLRKSASAPIYEPIQSALLVGDAKRAAFLAAKFRSESGDQKKALETLKSSVKGRQPFRVGPFTSDEHKVGFMIWARKHLSPADFKQASRVQYRYEAAAKSAGLW